MKKGAKAQLSYKWWSDNKAKSLKKTGLGKALQAYEKADRAADKHCKVEVLGIKYNALRDVKAAAQKGVGLCIPKVHAETRSALKTYDGVVKSVADPLKALIDRVKKEIVAVQALGQKNQAKGQAATKQITIYIKQLRSEADAAEGHLDPIKAAKLVIWADKILANCKLEYQKTHNAQGQIAALMAKCSQNVLNGHSDVVDKAYRPLGQAMAYINQNMIKDEIEPLVKRIKKAAAALDGELNAYTVPVKKMNQAAKQLSPGCSLKELRQFRQGPLRGQLAAAGKLKRFDPKNVVKLWTSVDDVIDKLGDGTEQKTLDRVVKYIQATEKTATGAAEKIGLQV